MVEVNDRTRKMEELKNIKELFLIFDQKYVPNSLSPVPYKLRSIILEKVAGKPPRNAIYLAKELEFEDVLVELERDGVELSKSTAEFFREQKLLESDIIEHLRWLVHGKLLRDVNPEFHGLYHDYEIDKEGVFRYISRLEEMIGWLRSLIQDD